MDEKQKKPNLLLRLERKNRGWSQARLAELIGADNSMVSRWETGERHPEPFYQEKLCTLFNKSATELGFLEDAFSPQVSIQSSLMSKQHLTTQDSMNLSHQHFMEIIVLPRKEQAIHSESQLSLLNATSFSSSISATSIGNLATITQLFRIMQRHGDTFIIDSINTHICTLQNILSNVYNDKQRQELWKILAQTQLIAAFHPRRKSDIAKTKMFYECAIASAQNSEDKQLIGASIGHLAHFSLRQEHDINKAAHLLEQAQEHFPDNHPFNGWLALLLASISSKEHHRIHCEGYLAYAIQIANELSTDSEYSDIYYTDFSYTSALIFTINCWLSMQDATKAYEALSKINLDDLSDNRRASAFYDAARIFSMQGTLEMAQDYAFQAVNKALSTRQLYVIPRCTALAQTILQKEPNEVHASAIIDFATEALQYEENNR